MGDDHDDDDEFSDPEADGDSPLRRADHGGGGDDDFDEFEDSVAGGADPSPKANTMTLKNQQYDEAMELSESDADSLQASPAGGAPTGKGGGYGGGAGGAGRGNSSSRPRADAITNQPYDEEMELSSEGSVDDRDDPDDDDGGSPGGPDMDPTSARDQMNSSMGMGGAGRGAAAPPAPERGGDDEQPPERQRRPGAPSLGAMPPPAPEANDDDDDDRDYGGEEGAGAPVPEGLYDPSEYATLPVSADIKELFQHITRYKAHNIELETKMRPFIPDYIPAVGDIDPFIKVPRPDGKTDNLGLVTLDEPASVQSDPTVLTLQLRAVTKSSGAQPMLVRSIEHAEKDPKAITGWISSISDLHRHKPAPSVRYSKPMPDIEQLMQIWPAPIEELLEHNPLPDADISLDLASYVRMVCAMLDIPIYGSLTEALHVVFTLYSDFKANVHFQQQMQQQEQQMGGGSGPSDSMSFE